MPGSEPRYACIAHVIAWHLAADPRAAAGLRRSVEARDASAAAIFLLAPFRDADTQRVLSAAGNSSDKVKLVSWLPPVAAALPATMVSCSQSAGAACEKLARELASDELDTRVFVLEVLDEMDLKVLRGVLPYLRDEREIADGVPSHATPRRRVCDRALDALRARLKLSLGFAERPNARYTASELAEALKAASQAVGATNE